MSLFQLRRSAPETAADSAAIVDRPTPWTGFVLLMVAVFTPVMAYASQEGLVPLIAGAGAALIPSALFRRRLPSVGTALLLGLVVWGLVSLSWSVAAPKTPNFHRFGELQALTSLKLLLELGLYSALVAGYFAASERAAGRAAVVLGVLISIMALVVAAEAFNGAAWFQWLERTFDKPMRPDWAARNVARATYFIAVLFWPLAHVLARGRLKVFNVLMLGGGILAALVLDTDAPLAALIVGAIVYGLVRNLGRPILILCMLAVAVYFVAAPFVVQMAVQNGLFARLQGHMGASWAERLRIWSFTDGLILQRPWLGWGAQASRYFQPVMPMHPHDAALQIWLELGLPGIALTASFWAWLFARMEVLRREDRNLAAAAAASAAAYLTISALSFDAWDVWWLALGALTLAVFVIVRKARRPWLEEEPADGLELIPIG